MAKRRDHKSAQNPQVDRKFSQLEEDFFSTFEGEVEDAPMKEGSTSELKVATSDPDSTQNGSKLAEASDAFSQEAVAESPAAADHQSQRAESGPPDGEVGAAVKTSNEDEQEQAGSVDEDSHSPPPVPQSFTTEAVPDAVSHGAARPGISLSAQPVQDEISPAVSIEFPVSSVEEALEALSAEDVNMVDDDDAYDDDYDDEGYEDDDESEEDMVPLVVVAADEDELSELALAGQPPPVEDPELLETPEAQVPEVEDGALQNVGQGEALEAELTEPTDDSAADLPESALPWSDIPGDGAADLPDAEGVQLVAAIEPEAQAISGPLAPAALASALTSQGDPWSLCQPLANLPDVPEIDAIQQARYTASLELLAQELSATTDGARRVSLLLNMGELCLFNADVKAARAHWLQALEIQDDNVAVRTALADLVRCHSLKGEAVTTLEALAMVQDDALVPLTEAALYKSQEPERLEEVRSDLAEIADGFGPRSVGAYLLASWQDGPESRRKLLATKEGDAPFVRRHILMQRALLSAGACNDPSGAIGELQALLQEDAGDLTAMALLWRLAKDTDNQDVISTLAADRAKHAEGRQASHWWQIAAQALTSKGEESAALSALAQAYQADPEDRVLEWRLEKSLAQRGRWLELAELLGPTSRYRSKEEQAVRLARLATIQLANADDTSALQSIEAAIELFPNYGWARQNRLKLLQRQGKPGELIEDLCARAAACKKPELRAAFLYSAALSCERSTNDVKRAVELSLDAWSEDANIAYFLTALRLSLATDNTEVLSQVLGKWSGPLSDIGVTGPGLAALLSHVGATNTTDSQTAFLSIVESGATDLLAIAGSLRHVSIDHVEDLISTLEIVQSSLPEASRAWLLFELGRISQDLLNNEAASLGFFKDSLSCGPEFRPCIWALKALGQEVEEIDGDDGQQALIRELWPELDSEGDWSAFLSEGVGAEEDDSLSFVARGFALVDTLDASALAEHLDGVNSAWATWHRGRLLVETGDTDLGYQVLAAAEVQEPDETLAAELLWNPSAGLQALSVQAAAQPRLWLPLARFALAIADPLASEFAQKALNCPEDAFAATALLVGIGVERGVLTHTAEQCKALAEVSDDGALRGAHLWLAGRLFAMAGQVDAALACVEGAANEASSKALALDDKRLLLRGEPARYVAYLDQLEGSDPADPPQIMHKSLWLEASGDGEGAASRLESLVSDDENHAPGWIALTRVQATLKNWSGVAQALESHAAITQSSDLETSLTERWEEIRAERLEDPAARESRLRRLWASEEAISPSFEKLLELMEEQDRVSDQLTCMLTEISRLEAGDLRADLRSRYANKLLMLGQDIEGAWQAYMDVLDDRPGDTSAINSLESIAEQRQDWNGLVAVLARRAVSSSDEARVEIYRRIARIWDDKLGQPQTAAASWEKVLSLSSEDQESLEALVRLYRVQEKWQAFADAVDRLLSLGVQDGELQQELGVVLATRLDKVAESATHLRAAALNGYVAESALITLGQHHEQKSEWQDAVEAYRLIASRGKDQVKIYEAWSRLDVLARERLHDEELALEAEEALFALRPEDPEAIYRLALGYDLAGRPTEALDMFELIGQHPEFLASLEDDDKHRFYSRLAHYLDQEGRVAEALPAYETVLQLDPEDRQLESRILQLLQEVGEWAKCADHIEGMLERRGLELSTAEQVKLCLELGRSARRAGQPERGIRAYERVTGMAPNEVAAYLGLIVIRKQQEEWNKLLGLYNQVIRYSTDPAQVVQAYVDKADILDVRLGASDRGYVDKAAMHFEKALQFDRRNTYCMMRLAEIALRERRFEKAGRWLQSLFGSGPSMSFQARGHVLNGILAAEFQKDSGTAKSHFKRASAVASISQVTVTQLSAAAQLAPGNLESLLGLYTQIVQEFAPVAD